MGGCLGRAREPAPESSSSETSSSESCGTETGDALASDWDALEALEDGPGGTPTWALAGVRLVRVVKVYDGDTVHLAVVAGRPGGRGRAPFRFRCRLLDQDAPEMRGPQRPFGAAARDVAAALVGGRLAFADFGEGAVGKFGRPLARLYVARAPGAPRPVAAGPRRIPCPPTADAPRGGRPPAPAELAAPGGPWIRLTSFLLEHRLTKPYAGRGARTGYGPAEVAACEAAPATPATEA